MTHEVHSDFCTDCDTRLEDNQLAVPAEEEICGFLSHLFGSSSAICTDNDDDNPEAGMLPYNDGSGVHPHLSFERDGLEEIGTGLRAALGVCSDDFEVDEEDCNGEEEEEDEEDDNDFVRGGSSVDFASDGEAKGSWGASWCGKVDQYKASSISLRHRQNNLGDKLGRRHVAIMSREGYNTRDIPKKRTFFFVLATVVTLFVATFSRQLGIKTAPAECSPMRHAPFAGMWHYCGPTNGQDFMRDPYDVLDVVCAQHDFCIERSHYNVGGVPRSLYPIGEESGEFRRCGIPLQSHTVPSFGCQIKRCDSEMVESLTKGVFQCSADVSLPRSRWCSPSSGYLGSEVCPGGFWRAPFCKLASAFVRSYHQWKVQRTCRVMGKGSGNHEESEWNCTCAASGW